MVETTTNPDPAGASSHDARAEEKLRDRLSAFVARLTDEAQRRVGKRLTVEKRWIDDLQQYHGGYSDEVYARLKKSGGSQVFINLTATKTDALEARLWDLLFPTDDKNWGISPTPVPELTDQAEAALAKVDEARTQGDVAQADAAQQMAAGNTEAAAASEQRMRAAETAENEAQAAADDLHEKLNEAKARADLMQEEIHDQFVTCRLQSEARDVISDACKIGIGVIKGPIIGEGNKQRFVEQPIEGKGPMAYVLERVEKNAPAAHRVDPWGFFPDPDTRRVADMEGFFERHLMNKTRLRKLARRPDMDQDAIRELLRVGPDSGATPAYMVDLHALNRQTDGDVRDKFQVWEYTGPIDSEEMETLLEAFPDDASPGGPDGEIDPLVELHARCWFCQGTLLSFALHPLDSNDPLYSVFTIRPDETTVFGFGIPWIMRHPQSVLNGAFRMMMDNSGLSTGPQIVINKDQVEPEDGNWTLEPHKVWLRNSAQAQPGVKPFETFDIPSNQVELANIIEIAAKLADEVTSMPALAQGEQGVGVTKTAQGMALLMNSANVTFRRIVKNFDDDITEPLVSRFYHWNMQFSSKDAIKGDYEVQARGSGVLLVREMQAQNLLMIANLFGDHPVYGPMLKHGNLLRHIFRAHMIAADEITKTDREYEQWMAEQEEKVDPAGAAAAIQKEIAEQEFQLRRDEMDHKTALTEMEWDARLQVANLTYDVAMEKVASALNMKRDELDAKIAGEGVVARSKERIVASEIAMKERTGESSGGSI